MLTGGRYPDPRHHTADIYPWQVNMLTTGRYPWKVKIFTTSKYPEQGNNW